MPAFLTHKIAADNIHEFLKTESPDAAAVIEKCPAAYYSGAQGGDYFFDYKYYSMWAGYRFKMFGWSLHRARVRDFFMEGAPLIKSAPNDVVKAYFLGYITHYALDVHAHPLIRKIGPKPMSSHNAVEYALDCMYGLKNGVDAWHFDKAQFIHDTLVPTYEIDDFLSAMMDKLYGEYYTLPPKPYHTAYSYLEKYERIMAKSGILDTIWRYTKDIFIFLQTKWLRYFPYAEIKDKYDYPALFETLDAGIEQAVRQIDAVVGYWDGVRDFSVLEELFYHVNMNGDTVVPWEERTVFKKMYKKAPLVLKNDSKTVHTVPSCALGPDLLAPNQPNHAKR